jgi:hypothetical protein
MKKNKEVEKSEELMIKNKKGTKTRPSSVIG